MFIVSVYKSLGASHILSQVVSGDDVLHVLDPGHQVPEVSQEAVEVVRVIQASLPVCPLVLQLLPVVHNLSLLSIDLWSLLFVDVFQSFCLFAEGLNL